MTTIWVDDPDPADPPARHRTRRHAPRAALTVILGVLFLLAAVGWAATVLIGSAA